MKPPRGKETLLARVVSVKVHPSVVPGDERMDELREEEEQKDEKLRRVSSTPAHPPVQTTREAHLAARRVPGEVL
ncbi:Hypothetical protein SMAX5B_007089 [Scophthalmus maximus]|uniref:Uncharacterized protein n=1 Tax=Scophthalmus maximus TaxID=52904 RepID=A0A2U9B0L1_SCOMX|nr:Hypothetical protein SMAX5B_007089 [Scophthalmus maximus]